MNYCKMCGKEISQETAFENYGVCDECLDEWFFCLDFMLDYANEDREDFYVRYWYGVEGDYLPSLLIDAQKCVKEQIKNDEPGARTSLRDYCQNDLSEFVNFCLEKIRKSLNYGKENRDEAL